MNSTITLSPGEVLGFLLGTSVNIALLSFGARRLLGMRFPLLRTVCAGLVGQSAATPVIAGLAGGQRPGANAALAPFFLFVMLGTTVGLLVMMIVLVVWEALVPTGSVPPMRGWIPGLRRRFRRGLRYAHVSQVLARHGLGSLLQGRGAAPVRGVPDPTGGESDHRRARALASALEECGTTFTKLGQVLATRRDLLPPAYVASLGRLQDRTGTAPWPELAAVVESELGAPVAELFERVEEEPLASASVAQVHAVRLPGGVDAVVKIQRPGVKAQVTQDLDILRRLAARLEDRAVWARTMGVGNLAAGFDQSLREELDFRVEAENLAAVAAAGERPGIRIPRAYADLCTSRVLVMERLSGLPLSRSGARIDELGLSREVLARTLLEELLRQMLLDGVFHADPHPGNILLLDDGSLGLIDFGSVGRLDSTLREALQRMMFAFGVADSGALADALLDVVSRPDELDLPALERALGSFMARHLAPGGTLDARVFTDLTRLVTRFGLPVPPELAAVFRALATLEGVLTELSPGFDLIAAARSFGARAVTEQLEPEQLRRRAAEELLALLPALRRLPRRVDRIASALEDGRLNVNVRLLADRRDRRTAAALIGQLVSAVIAATCGLMAVRLLGMTAGPRLSTAVTLYQFFGYCLLVIASILALRLLLPVLRAPRDDREG
ncbi:ubiquinone biosynthesis protein [Streptacidiphilus sp. MAP12-33]|uniref:ABC1 kinase family protein n=1 Tax=Streptacidiphilus sp. MAP12-33 TaxID=3156266 RepID=UPI003511EADA